MNSKGLISSRKVLYIIALVLAVLVGFLVLGGKLSILGIRQPRSLDVSRLVAGSSEKFVVLSSHSTDGNVGST